jgi:hypothetical protein
VFAVLAIAAIVPAGSAWCRERTTPERGKPHSDLRGFWCLSGLCRRFADRPSWRDVEQPSCVAPPGRHPGNTPVFSVGTASAAATRVGRRNWALRFVTFAVPRHTLAAAAIIGWLGPGSFAACAGRGHAISRITGSRIAAMRTCAPSWCISTGRPLTGGRIRRRPAARPGRARTGRRPTLPGGATSEPRDRRQNQNTPGGGAEGVGDEYAISAAANPAADQSAHRCSVCPNRRRSVSPAPEGVFCHAAKGSAERKGRTPSSRWLQVTACCVTCVHGVTRLTMCARIIPGCGTIQMLVVLMTRRLQ